MYASIRTGGVSQVTASLARRRRKDVAATVEGFELYRSRPINSRMKARFPHVLYYAVHFDEEALKFLFAFLGPDGRKDSPDVLLGLDAQAQWNRCVDIMIKDPLVSGVRVERIGSHSRLEDCIAAARADAVVTASDTRRRAPPAEEPAIVLADAL
jgi:hypothetical protein